MVYIIYTYQLFVLIIMIRYMNKWQAICHWDYFHRITENVFYVLWTIKYLVSVPFHGSITDYITASPNFTLQLVSWHAIESGELEVISSLLHNYLLWEIYHIDGLMQKRCDSIADTLKLCIKPSIYFLVAMLKYYIPFSPSGCNIW